MRRSLLASAGALALSVASPVRAEVVMQDGHGRVEVLSEGSDRGVGILPGEKLGAGTLSVGAKSHATFKTAAGTVDLDGVARAKLADDKVSLESGSVQAAASGKALVIEAPSGLSASGSGKFEVALVGSKTRVTSREGAVQLALNGSKQELAAGKSIELGKNDALADAPAADAKPEKAKPTKPVEVAAVDPEQAKPAPAKPAPEAAKPEAPKPDEPAAPPAPPAPPKIDHQVACGHGEHQLDAQGPGHPGIDGHRERRRRAGEEERQLQHQAHAARG